MAFNVQAPLGLTCGRWVSVNLVFERRPLPKVRMGVIIPYKRDLMDRDTIQPGVKYLLIRLARSHVDANKRISESEPGRDAGNTVSDAAMATTREKVLHQPQSRPRTKRSCTSNTCSA